MNSNHDVRAGVRVGWYGVVGAISALTIAYGLVTPDKAQLWVTLIVALVPNVASAVLAIRHVKTTPADVPSTDDIVSAVLAALSHAPSAAAVSTDHGPDVAGVPDDAPAAE